MTVQVAEPGEHGHRQRRDDELGQRVVPILIHGDAAFAGQGVVMETLQLSQAKGYATGGTVHLIVNNQIGFTTPNPIEAELGREARTSRYCTDLAKMLESPVFHVNGDDPEAVCFATRLAVDFRNEFHKDVIIDICCYRRLGHNEADEPSVTSPQMYEAIKQHPTTMTLYARRLAEEQVVNAEEADALMRAYREVEAMRGEDDENFRDIENRVERQRRRMRNDVERLRGDARDEARAALIAFADGRSLDAETAAAWDASEPALALDLPDYEPLGPWEAEAGE